jgi:hypothetical protein
MDVPDWVALAKGDPTPQTKTNASAKRRNRIVTKLEYRDEE